MTGRLTSTKQSRRVDRVSFQGDRILANLSAEGQLVRHLQIRGDKGTAKNKLHGPPQFRGVFDQVNCPKSDIFSDNFMQGNLNLSLQINCSPEHISLPTSFCAVLRSLWLMQRAWILSRGMKFVRFSSLPFWSSFVAVAEVLTMTFRS